MDTPNRSRSYLNGVLTVIAGLLALLVADRLSAPDASLGFTAAAVAQPDDESQPSGGLVSAADQRKLMIAELRKMSKRLDSIQSRLDSGLTVKVTEMPEIKFPKEAKD